MNMFAKIACGVALATLCGAAQATTTLDFDTGVGRFDSENLLVGYIKEGYSLTPTDGFRMGVQATSSVNKAALRIQRQNFGTQPQYFSIVSSGPFAARSFDLQSQYVDALLILTGYFGDSEIFQRTYTRGDVINRFQTFTIPGGVIDRLSFSGTEGAMLIDNIVLTNAVPEPSTWALMLAGFGVVGASLRRRRPARAVLA